MPRELENNNIVEGNNEPVIESNEPTTVGDTTQVSQTEANKVEPKNEPFATFKDEKSFMSRVNREGKKQVKQLLETLGLEDEDALKNIIKEKHDAEEAQKTELEKALEKIKSMEESNTKLTEAQKINDTKMKAIELGVDTKKVDYLLKLVDMDNAEESINTILTDMPEFRAQQQVIAHTDPKGGSDFSGGDSNSAKPLTKEIISKMSTKEVQERYSEVMEFLKNNKH